MSRGGSLRERASAPGTAPGWWGSGNAWERQRSFLSPGAWHTDGSLTAEPRPGGLAAGPVNQSPGLVRISCCFRQLLHTHITWDRRRDEGGISNI